MTKETPIFAYTDEAGNTGLNIFDRDQPVFHTLTLFAKQDLNAEAAGPVAEWCAALGVDELHAADLGVGRLSTIATSMNEFIMAVNPLFVVTAVEKRHLAAMKFADTVLDSGLNEAVAGFHYWSRPWRLRMSLDLANHMTPRCEREFWEAYRRCDYAKFSEIADRVESSIAIKVRDRRARQLLGDALKWASKHPEELLVKQTKLDAPNLVAFSFILQALHQMFKETSYRVKVFVHDEQNEFMKSFRMMYDAVSRFRFEDKSPALLPDWEEAETFDCPLTEETSSSAPALQLVDVLLWLLRRFLAKGTTGSKECDELLVPLLIMGTVHEFSRQQLLDSVEELLRKIMTTDVTPKALRDGAKLLQAMEEARIARMGKQPG